MLRGSLFRLSRDTCSLESTGGRKNLIRVPKGAVIEVLKLDMGPEGRQMAQVRWMGKTVEMFAEDIERRGEAIQTQLAGD
jgi:hypothetical protein